MKTLTKTQRNKFSNDQRYDIFPHPLDDLLHICDVLRKLKYFLLLLFYIIILIHSTEVNQRINGEKFPQHFYLITFVQLEAITRGRQDYFRLFKSILFFVN